MKLFGVGQGSLVVGSLMHSDLLRDYLHFRPR